MFQVLGSQLFLSGDLQRKYDKSRVNLDNFSIELCPLLFRLPENYLKFLGAIRLERFRKCFMWPKP